MFEVLLRPGGTVLPVPGSCGHYYQYLLLGLNGHRNCFPDGDTSRSINRGYLRRPTSRLEAVTQTKPPESKNVVGVVVADNGLSRPCSINLIVSECQVLRDLKKEGVITAKDEVQSSTDGWSIAELR